MQNQAAKLQVVFTFSAQLFVFMKFCGLCQGIALSKSANWLEKGCNRQALICLTRCWQLDISAFAVIACDLITINLEGELYEQIRTY